MENEFFKSERDKYIFCLTQLDGTNRNRMIGLTDDVYDSIEFARNWYKGILEILGPDDNTESTLARNNLSKLYNNVLSSFIL